MALHEKSFVASTNEMPQYRQYEDQDASEDELPLLEHPFHPKSRSTSARRWAKIAHFVVLISLGAVIVVQQLQLRQNGISLWSKFTYSIPIPRDVPRKIHGPSKFLSPNNTWDDVDAGHGVVALDTQWALKQGLPKTMAHPRDASKSIYTIAAYHSIHCLKFIRQHYLTMAAGGEMKWDIKHDMHCFDGLRQLIMCDANSNLLWATGRKDVGHGQTLQCRSWDALRNWASANTACYSDLAYPSKITRWGRCDEGHDGLPEGSLLGEVGPEDAGEDWS